MDLTLFRSSETYLAAVSGGGDSMAMAHMLLQHGVLFAVAHVNYHHREEADAEEHLVRAFAKEKGIPVFVHHAFYPGKGNFEDWARRTRYRFFHEICLKEGYSACVVAHHLDDALETYLLQKQRKGQVTFYGLQAETVIYGTRILRPLLSDTKESLRDYCRRYGIPYSEDSSNADIGLARNRIRHLKLAEMTKEQKESLLEEIARSNESLKEMDERIETDLARRITVSSLRTYRPELRARFLYTWILRETGIRCGNKRTEDLTEKIFRSSGNLWMALDEENYLLKEYDCLQIVKKNRYNYHIIVAKPTVIENEWIFLNLLDDPGRFYIREDSYPLTVEIAAGNDRIRIGKQIKAVNRIWIEGKIPALQRLYWPKIVNNKGQILFVPRTSADEMGLYLVK